MALSDYGSSKGDFINLSRQLKTDSINDVLVKFGTVIVEKLQDGLRTNQISNTGSIASGNLLDSIRFTIQMFGQKHRFELRLEDYYKWVDEGRKPGTFPPISSIERWIEQKNIQPKTLSSLRTKKTYLAKKKDLAFLFGRKIKERGIPATNFYKETVNDKLVVDLTKALSKAFKKDVVVELKLIKSEVEKGQR